MKIRAVFGKRVNYGMTLLLQSEGEQVKAVFYGDSKKQSIVIQNGDPSLEKILQQNSAVLREQIIMVKTELVNKGEASFELEILVQKSSPENFVAIVYSDGGASPNPGPGSFGVVIDRTEGANIEMAGYEGSKTTNNRMELMGVITGLLYVKKHFSTEADYKVVTDSSYVKNGITRWIFGWKKNGWKTKNFADVKNRDLWERLDELNGSNIAWEWVKGHAGHPENERCDELVGIARMDKKNINLDEIFVD